MILNRLVAVLILATFSFTVKAQLVHFVYLQTENSQPFYVKLDNKVTSSSPAGYLILPKMADGDYKISVGFPKKEFPEENFQLSVDKDNKGFLLKNFGEKGWGLFNLQSFALVMGDNANSPAVAKTLQDDPFSRMLANVVKDSTLLEKQQPLKPVENPALDTPTVKPLIIAAETNQTQSKNIDSADSSKNVENAIAPVIPADSTQTAPALSNAIALSTITGIFQKKEKEGMELIYVDKTSDYSDTVRIFIPGDTGPVVKPVSATVSKVNSSTGNKVTSDTVAEENSASRRDNVDATTIYAETKDSSDSVVVSHKAAKPNDTLLAKSTPPATLNISGDDINKQESIPKVVNSSSTNSDCKEFASNEDYLKLRKKIAAEKDKDDMIKVAVKFFRLQCYSTEQVKNLSLLFLTDGGKFQFFETAYPFTSDSSQYHILQSQLKDPFYVNKFKAMMRR